jgi:hypothetical protein
MSEIVNGIFYMMPAVTKLQPGAHRPLRVVFMGSR